MNASDINAVMLDLLSKGADIQTIVDKGAAILKAPMLVSDTRFRILYMSQSVNSDIEMWNIAKEERFITEEVLKNMQADGSANDLTDKLNPMIAALPNGYHAMRCPLRYKGRYRGFVGIYDYIHPFGEKEIDAVTSVAKAITALLPTDQDLINIDETIYESFLYQLLDTQNIEQAAVICKKYSSISFSKNKLLICFSSDGHQRIPNEKIRDLFRKELYAHTSVITNNMIIVLLEPDKIPNKNPDELLSKVHNLACRNHLYAGISFPFTDTSFVPYAFQQSKMCLPYCNENQIVTSFETCLEDSMMECCLAKWPLDFFIHPIVRKLTEHDKEYNLNYIDTLRAYIQSFGNLKATAAALNIHYNTIKYRMAVMENITSVDICGKGDLIPILYFSLKLLSHES